MDFEQRRKILLAAGLTMGNFMTASTGAIVPVALPSIMEYFQIKLVTAGLIAMTPLVIITGLIVPAGKLADMIGRKRIYLLGIAVFMVGSLLCGMSFSVGFLLVASVVQSIGASAVFACGPAIISMSFPKGHMGKAFGLVGFGVSLGLFFAPALGGYIIQYAGWRFVYFVGIPIGFINFILLRWNLTADAPEVQKKSFDVAGTVSLFIFAVFFILAMNQGSDLGFSSAPFLLMVLVSGLAFLFFMRQEGRTPDPIVKLSIFRNKILTFSIISRTLFFIISNVFMFTLPFYLQQVLHFTPSRMGLIICPIPIMRMIISPISGWISDYISSRWLTTGGMIVLSLVAVLLTTMGMSATPDDILIRFLLIGLGLGIFAVPNMSALIRSVDRQDLGFASSSIALFRNLGMALGIASANAVITFSLNSTKKLSHHVEEELFLRAIENAWWLAVVLGLIGAAVSLIKVAEKN